MTTAEKYKVLTPEQRRREELLALALAHKNFNYVPQMETRNKTYSASLLRPGEFSANCKPATTAKQAAAHNSVTRQRQRADGFRTEFAAITKKFGGESRKIRRQLARDIAKNTLKQRKAVK